MADMKEVLRGALLVWNSNVLTLINLPYISVTMKQKCCELAQLVSLLNL